ncbi:putative disease resistance RPP13-like protein 1 [Macadamia integrifolia]|uniref:putative disease resistance RPP13-like protein 1 n=1 Tax=Macadamia integrifolia TaxID=60698 RepID=UPI001C4F2FCC|nr:putative disease resistance RPP13-like protein 1 [Macadamia integrifolia]
MHRVKGFWISLVCASELSALSGVLGKIQELLKFAEQAQAKNMLVKRWLRYLRDVGYRAEDILDEFIYEARKEKDKRYGGRKVPFFHSNINENGILRKNEIVPLINDELIKELVEIEKKLEDHYLRELGNWKSHRVTDEIDTRLKSSSLVDESFTLGRKEDEEVIKNKLLYLDENQKQVSFIAIVGLGGVGKTTLAQLIYNDPDVEKHFERRAWVCVSTDFNLVRLTSAILESLTGKNPDLSNVEPLQRKLREELRGNRLLIVLDDVWTEKDNDWKALRVAFMAAGEGGKIIVTTRSRRVSSMMHPILEAVGRNIARKCKGLPLAASTVAGILSSGSDLNHWEEVLNSSLWDLEESNLPAALSLSYYFLPTNLKQCFSYCSVFPKDFKFDKQRLIQLWIAEGFIRWNTTRMKDKGGQQFDDLLHSIRRLPDSLCDLHNLQSLILCHSGISELPRGMKYLRNLQHLDIYGCRYLCSLPQEIGRLNSLKTLSKFPISKDDDGCGIRELKELRQLAGVLSICSLENVIHPLEAREADMINKPKIDDFTLSCFLRGGDSDIEEVFESLRPHTELKSLHMNSYYGLTFPRWLMIELPSYKQLVSLTLTLCWKCRVLPPIGELSLLESLCIDKMFELEKWSSSSRGAETEFPSLLRLNIESCSALRVLPQPLLSSPRLCELSIKKCPRLRMLRHDGESKLTPLKNLHLGEGMEGLVQSLDETQDFTSKS